MTTADVSTYIRKHPLSIGCGLVALIFAGATYFRRSEAPEISALLEQKTTERARLAANVKNSAQLTDQLAKLTAADKAIQQRVVQASDLANNLQYFYRIETETGTKLIELHQNPLPKKTAKPGAFGVGFTVLLQGDYVSLIDVLRRIENGRHFARLTSAAFTSAGGDRNSPLKLELVVELLGQP